MTHNIQSLAVYCGASEGNHPVYREAAVHLGKLLVAEKIRLVYGGGSIGLMGIVADTVLQQGGEAIGVIPGFLDTKEVGHKNLSQMHVVNSMHERKALMERLCDGIIALPGGYGTMDELFEMLTWKQLGLHAKPIGLLNVRGYYNAFIDQLNHMVEAGFLKMSNRNLIAVSDSPEKLLQQMRAFNPLPEEKWMNRGQE